MRIVVLGAGALGSIIAAHLARAGNDVALIARGERARLLAEGGLKVSGLADFSTPVEVVERPAELQAADLLILAVKTYDSAAAIDSVRHMKVESAFSIQNGVKKNEELVDAFGTPAVLGSVSMISGAVEADGTANFMANNPTIVGELSGGTSARADDIVARFEAAGLAAAASENVLSVEWSKFIAWLGLSALAVLTRVETWKFLSDADSARVAARIIREAAQLPGRLGIPLNPGPPFMLDALTGGSEDEAAAALQERGRAQGETAPGFRQSMLQDADRGKRIEVEETFGYLLEQAGEHGLAMPSVETCYRILAAVNRFGQ